MLTMQDVNMQQLCVMLAIGRHVHDTADNMLHIEHVRDKLHGHERDSKLCDSFGIPRPLAATSVASMMGLLFCLNSDSTQSLSC